MDMESLFHTAFWLVFVGMLLIQASFSFRARYLGMHQADKREIIEGDEGWGHTIVRSSRAIVLVVFLVLYAINWRWLDNLKMPIPDWMRWFGAFIGTSSLLLYIWSRYTLGKEWSSPLRVRKRHHLITTGPYAWVRHPIYLSMILFMISLALITSNLILVLFLVVSYIDLQIRIPKEERMMIDEFGDKYEIYLMQTGRLLPKKGSFKTR